MRFRLWIAALGGSLVAVAGFLWIAVEPRPEGPRDAALLLRLALIGAGSLVVGIWLGWWLDHGIVARIRRITSSIRVNDATALHEPQTDSGWGELADLRNHVVALITRYRQAARAADQLQIAERQIHATRQTILHWIESEHWVALPPGVGALHGLSEALNRGFQREAEVQEQNQEAARQIQAELGVAAGDARETAEQAERGFVEATSLLTTVRELERLGGELHQALATRAAADRDTSALRDWLTPVSEAVRELVETASGSVEDLTRGLERVQELSDEVQVLGNRATLIALNAVLASRRGEADAETAEDLKPLARDARVATDRALQLAREIQERAAAASERMKGVRERVAERLARLEPPRTEETPLRPDTQRALDRVREMVTDAARKAERLSAAGERSSRAADRLVRRLEDEVRDVEGLVVRLSPPSTGVESRTLNRRDERPVHLDVIALDTEVIEESPEHERRPGAAEDRS